MYVSDEDLLSQNVTGGDHDIAMDDYEMIPISEIAENEGVTPMLIVEDICSTDIQQGGFRSCAILAMLGGLAANRDDILKEVILDPNDLEEDGEGNVPLPEGTFKMRIGRKIYEVELTVPVCNGTNENEGGVQDLGGYSIAGTKLINEDGYLECWPALVEKAWAAMEGAYDIMNEGGDGLENLEKLLPNEVVRVMQWNIDNDTVGPDEVTEWLDDCDDEELESVMIFMAHGNKTGQPIKGLHAGHQYSSIEIFQGEEDHHEIAIAVRNPWGTEEPVEDLTLGDLDDLPEEYDYLSDAIK